MESIDEVMLPNLSWMGGRGGGGGEGKGGEEREGEKGRGGGVR